MSTLDNPPQPTAQTGTARVKRGMAEMLKGGVIMDVVTPEQAKIAEDAGAVAVMALERVPAVVVVARRDDDAQVRRGCQISVVLVDIHRAGLIHT